MARILKKNLNLVIKGDKVSKNWDFEHFVGNWPLKCSNCLHDDRRQWSVSSECGPIFGENLDLGLIRVLHWD